MPETSSQGREVGAAAFRVATSDPEEHAEFWRAMGAERELDQLGAGRFRGLLAVAGGAESLATVSGYNRSVRVRGTAPRRRIGVAVDLGGQGRLLRRDGGFLPTNAAVLRGGGGEIDYVWEGGARVGAVVCDVDAAGPAGEAAGGWLEASAGPGDLLLPTSPESIAAFGRLLGVLRAVEDGTALPWSPAIDACVRDDLLLLAAAGPSPAAAGGAGAPQPASARRVRRAEEFARARLDRPVTLAELCAELGAGERTLRADFHARFGMGPMTYLRRLRLNGARRALRAGGGGGGASVTRAATDWGFLHFGEFAASYRALFGELPSETLRAARGAAG